MNYVNNKDLRSKFLKVYVLATILLFLLISKQTLAQTPGTLKWEFQMEGTVSRGESSPAIGADGTIYTVSLDGLYAINPDGTKKWEFQTEGGIYRIIASPAIGADGTIYVAGGYYSLYAINPDGTLKWEFRERDHIGYSPAIGADGTIYVGWGNGNLIAINPDGTKKWEFQTGEFGNLFNSTAVGGDGTIYLGSWTGKLYAINPDGTKKWEFQTEEDGLTSFPAIGADGTIYVGGWGYEPPKLYAINPDGTKKWEFQTAAEYGDIPNSPVIGADGTIYVGSLDYYDSGHKLIAINPNGTKKWEFQTEEDGNILNSPAIGADGTIYVGILNKIYAINSDGTKKWEFQTETDDASLNSPAIGADGTIYVGSRSDNIYAIYSDSLGLADSPWPMFYHDVKHTGNVRVLKEDCNNGVDDDEDGLVDCDDPECCDVQTCFGKSECITLVETLLAQEAVLNNVTVSGDFDSTLNFTSFEMVSITTGVFAGYGFSKGECETILDGIPYKGEWRGVVFSKPDEDWIYIKGAVFGEISATVEGHLTESVSGSGIYDQYQATWQIGRLGVSDTSVIIELNGDISYQSSSEFTGTDLYFLQDNIDTTDFGDYGVSLSTVLTHLRVVSPGNPYFGEGFSMISYNSEAGSGNGWMYNKRTYPGFIEMKGLFSSPLYGIATGILSESELPRVLPLAISRIDLGLPPMADLDVRTWGPGRVSPGQTVDYMVEYRNDGVSIAEDVVVVLQLPPQVDYISSTSEGIYRWETHEMIWKLGTLTPQSKGNLAAKVRVQWGLPWGTQLESFVVIDTLSDEIDKMHSPEVTPSLDIFDYLTYEPVKVALNQYMTKTELDFYLSDPAFQNTFTYAEELGFLYSEMSTKTDFTDGSYQITSLMDSGSDDELILDIHYYGEIDTVHMLIKMAQEKVEFFDREGGTTYPDGSSPFDWGTWGLHNSCSLGECVNNCVEKKIPGYATELIPWEKFKRVISMGVMFKDCRECAQSGFTNQAACDACASNLAGLGGPIGSLAVDLLTCHMDCSLETKPLEYVCNDGEMRSYCAKGLQKIIIHPQAVIYDECLQCRWFFTGFDICSEAANEICINGSCVPKDQAQNGDTQGTIIATAHDPNIKYGPEGAIEAGQTLDYKVEYENEGEGIAFGVYFTDTLDEDLDDSTLVIGPVKDVETDAIIGIEGTYDPTTRTITWFVGNGGEVGPGEGGYAEFSVNLRNDAPAGTEVINFGTVYFPSVPEETRTNGIVSVVALDSDDDGLTDDVDNCPYVPNILQTNSDNDSHGDACDNCPDIDNEDQVDSDGNSVGDACENENAPPIAEAGPDHTTECTGNIGTLVTLDGSGSIDPDGDSMTYEWTWDGGSVSGVNPTIQLPLGTFTITLIVNDGKLDSDPDTTTVIIVDTTEPEINLSISPDTLWPPDHKMVEVFPSIQANDACCDDIDVELLEVQMDEGETASTFDPNFDIDPDTGSLGDDIQIVDGRIYLRAERAGNSDGRIYTITYKATDCAGNSKTASSTVIVPHDQSD